MSKDSVKKNIVLYKLFVLFDEPLFWGAILIISVIQLGHMTLSEIYILEACAMAVITILTIPLGALADIIGSKKVIIIGRIFLLASMIEFAVTKCPRDAWIANILWSIGFSFQSGADESFFYNNLKSIGTEADFKAIQGLACGRKLLLTGICSVSVGYLADINIRIPLFMSIPFMTIPLIAAFFFKEQPRAKKYSPNDQYKIIIEGIRFATKKAEIRWIIGFCVLISGASKLWFFTYNPYFERVGIPIKNFGWLFFMLNIIAYMTSRYADRIEKSCGEKKCIIGMIALIGIPILFMGLFPIWQMAFLTGLQNIVRSFIRPFRGDFANKHIDSDAIRTTVLSTESAMESFVAIFILWGFGSTTKSFDLLNSLVLLGTSVLILGTLSFKSYKKLNPK